MSDHLLPDDPSTWPRDPFRLLGVARGASERELRKAYHALIRKFKPEHAPEAFRRIRDAYEMAQKLADENVKFFTDDATREILKSSTLNLQPASEQNWFTEYNDFILNIRVVDGVKAAIDHINFYGSAHSDSIVTTSEEHAKRFLAEVDSAAVYWNASTRFTDGAEFGMGAEIGISTDKIGARGPMGLDELTSYKWLGFGSGQIRT